MIIGVDENNFSPSLAGDCVVVALARRPGTKKVRGVKDSKQLTHKQRLALFGKLQETSCYSVVPATVNWINSDGIYWARNMAIVNSASALLLNKAILKTKVDEEIRIIIDGPFSKTWMTTFSNSIRWGWTRNIKVECLVNGDEKVYEISAASIIGRIYADALFAGFGQFYPGYRLERNHGSPDKLAYEKIRQSGPTPYHRTNYGKGWWEKIYRGE